MWYLQNHRKTALDLLPLWLHGACVVTLTTGIAVTVQYHVTQS